MADDRDRYPFQPRLGRIRSRGDAAVRTHVRRVLAAVGRINPRRFGAAPKSGFSGTRIGRGAGAGHVAAWRGPPRGLRGRRVVVKFHIANLAGGGGGGGAAAARLHVAYIQREGVDRDGEPGKLYGPETDAADGKAFLKRCEGDRHQFRIIVSAEDGAELTDLKAYVRQVMARMETDLDTRLDWVAVDHYDTEHPHTHIVLRGKDDRGRDLIIARDYIAHGMRAQAGEILTEELGLRTDLEIEQAMRAEVAKERLTFLDREILRETDAGVFDGRGTAEPGFARFKQTLKLGRLEKLERLGLAEALEPGRWRIDPALETTLRALGRRGDIIKTMQADLAGKGLNRPARGFAIFDGADRLTKPLVGRVAAWGISDELRNRFYVVLDGVDGRTHYVELGAVADPADVTAGAVVEIRAAGTGVKPADRTIAAVAEREDGVYSDDAHQRFDKTARTEFRLAHVRRLEALRRSNLVARRPDGSWQVPEDYLARVERHEARRAARAPVQLETLSHLGLADMAGADGATWLDRVLTQDGAGTLAEAGFGAEARAALAARRAWLVREGLARDDQGETLYARGLLKTLQKRELNRVGDEMASALGKAHVIPGPGERVDGVYNRPVRLASGKYALIERGKSFSLVPWRDVLERSRGKTVSGVVRGATISWELGRQKGRGIN